MKSNIAPTVDPLASYADEHPDHAQWLTTASGPSAPCGDWAAGFAASLLSALRRWGTLTPAQHDAVGRAVTRAQTPPPPATRPATLQTPRLHEVMQRHTTFHAEPLTLSRRNADSLVWIKHQAAEKVIGKIEAPGTVTLWNRPGVDLAAVRGILSEFEESPLETAQRYGRLSGRCCSCGRDLTDPASIEAGIGPICAQRFN